ncbi:MocR-like pyridoxine biosynthesis transcription factor PdxR [Siphonobacter aquaeclarae]|uniref:GntR family transcriptional regulator / MocR family aminotransferase n=1 Tax=Siphonobacter aquaeclarae TaxID=563176 RepID=A0A1G9IPE5_9BACT|nr:PLP-dependent aminotransferase family protein [Siphonobacter aquaeclarae]SDL26764.1 GntR family transcriptional regulator / MocR family aminotransferase [Siphonobacter aquaeclarae]
MVQSLRSWKLQLVLDFRSHTAVFLQIADGIIAEIRKGRLQPGMPLPGSRVLAGDLGVNRKTVVLAYEELLAGGWAESSSRKGTFVSRTLPDWVLPEEQPSAGNAVPFAFNAFETLPLSDAGRGSIVFDDGLPDVKLAPLDELARAYRRIFRQKARWRMMGYGHEKGEPKLREALTRMLRLERGLQTVPENLCVTRGSQMALYLAAMTLVCPGDRVVVEDPGYSPAREVFRQAGAVLIPVAVDASGIRTDDLESICRQGPIKAVYVTPHHQFPTTVSLKADRRMHLLRLSRQYGFAVVEDDYDYEYHFGLRSVLPLASLDPDVIYIGSLSKLIAPAVRIGYLTGPVPFVDAVAALRMRIDRQGDTIMENAVAELMDEGIVSRHTRKAFSVYSRKRSRMEALLHQYLGDQVMVGRPEGGLAFWVPLRTPLSVDDLARAGVQVIDTRRFWFSGDGPPALRLGYASLTDTELEDGLRRIALALSAKDRKS